MKDGKAPIHRMGSKLAPDNLRFGGGVVGIDGYLYYTGLLQKAQRIVDGFEPNASLYPGQRGVGSLVEILPPLIKQLEINIDVTTNDGVNVNEISDQIKSSIISYINTLNVGTDVILSEVIVEVMKIPGVEAATFTTPSPDTERIAISDNEKAYISSDKINIA